MQASKTVLDDDLIVHADDLILDDFQGAIRWHFETQVEPHEEDFRIFSHFRGRNEMFLDVGANIGNSVVSFRLFNADCPIVSFEPCPWLESALRWIKQNRGEHYDFHMVGVSGTNETKSLFIPCVDNKPNFYLSSFVGHRFGPDPQAIEEMRSLLGAKPEHRYGVCVYPVELRPVDDFDLAPSIVKIDAETFEAEVLRGMTRTLASHRPLVMIEGGNKLAEVAAFFASRDYQFAQYDSGRLQPSADICRSDNGFFIAGERMPEYAARGILTTSPV